MKPPSRARGADEERPTFSRHRFLYRPLVLFIAMAVLISCSSSSVSSKAPLPPSAPVVEVTLTEYRFELEPSLPVGRVVFRFINRGSEAHWPSLFRLDDDFPSIQEEVLNTVPRFLPHYAEVPPRPPGSTGTFAVDLVPGQRYALVCFMTTADGTGHANKGMTWEARARGGPAEAVGTTAPVTTTVG